MKRFDQSRFVAFGLLPMLNALALLLYGLGLATHGQGGEGGAVPAAAITAGICLLCAVHATIMRGRDLGWGAGLTLLVFWGSLSLGPAVLVLMGYLAYTEAKPEGDRYGPAPGRATVATWLKALLNLIWPWIVVLAVRSIVMA